MKSTIFSLLDTPAFGGAEQYLLGHLYFLTDQGYSVVLATNNSAVKQRVTEENTVRHRHDQRSIKCIDAPYRLDAIGNWKGLVKYFLSLPLSLFWLWQTVLHLKDEGQTIIALLPGFSDRLSFSPLLKWLGCRLIWIEIGPLEPTFHKTWGFPRWLYHRTKHLPDHFITTSKFTRASMVSTGGIPAAAITLVYPGVPLFTDREIKALRAQGNQLRQRYHTTRCLLITYTGRLASENEVEVLIRAFSQLKKTIPNSDRLRLLIIGDGPERYHFETIANRLEVSEHVIFTGFVSEHEKFSWLATTDLFVFTRAWELDGFGMTTIEAMTVGTPVITTDFGPQREIVSHQVNGLRFKPHDSNHLAKQLVSLISNPSLRRRLGQAGLKYVRQNFDHRHQTKLLHDTVKKYG